MICVVDCFVDIVDIVVICELFLAACSTTLLPMLLFQATYKGWVEIIRDSVDSPSEVCMCRIIKNIQNTLCKTYKTSLGKRAILVVLQLLSLSKHYGESSF